MKCTHCSIRKAIYRNTYNFEGTNVPVKLCDKCLGMFITNLLDLVDYRYYRSTLEKYSGVTIERSKNEKVSNVS